MNRDHEPRYTAPMFRSLFILGPAALFHLFFAPLRKGENIETTGNLPLLVRALLGWGVVVVGVWWITSAV